MRSDDALTRLSSSFDLIHSYIVFQHTPVARGERIFAGLLEHLEPGGMGVVHFTFAAPVNWERRALGALKHFVPFYRHIRLNLLNGKPFFTPLEPVMQMNTYDINRLLALLQTRDVQRCHLQLTNHGGHLGVLLYFQKGELT